MSPLRRPPAAAGPPFSTLVTITGPSLTTAKPSPFALRWILTGRLSAASDILFVLTTAGIWRNLSKSNSSIKYRLKKLKYRYKLKFYGQGCYWYRIKYKHRETPDTSRFVKMAICPKLSWWSYSCVTWHVQNRAKCRKLTSPVLWGFIDWDQTVDRKTFAEFEEDTHRYKKFKVFDEASLSLKQTKLDRE